MSHSVGQSVIASGSFQGLVNNVLLTTMLRYHFLWACPKDLRMMLSTKAAHAAPLEAVDRISLVSDFLWKRPADNNQRSWDLDDDVIVIRSVPFLSQLNLHPGSVSVKVEKCLEPLEPFG